MSATTIHLVRHAAHDRLGRVLTGRMPDIRLGPEGLEQARALAQRLSSRPLSAILSSPLERCMETAEPIAAAHDLPVTTSEDLIEIDLGEWTGISFEDLHGDPRWGDWNERRATAAPPGGEGMAAVQTRVAGQIEAMRNAHPGREVALVTHSDVIKAAVAGILGLSLDRYDRFDIDPASVTTAVMWAGGGKVKALNQVAGAEAS